MSGRVHVPGYSVPVPVLGASLCVFAFLLQNRGVVLIRGCVINKKVCHHSVFAIHFISFLGAACPTNGGGGFVVSLPFISLHFSERLPQHLQHTGTGAGITFHVGDRNSTTGKRFWR